MPPVTLPILHFNDVYRVRQKDRATGGTIGADQFAAKIAQIRESWGEPSSLSNLPPPTTTTTADSKPSRDWSQHATHRQRKGLVLFSGDLFSPSVESSVTRGTHLVPVINAMNLDCACLGNHDWDFGYPHLQTLMAQCNFPWLFSNVVEVSASSSDPSSSTTDSSQSAAAAQGQTRGEAWDEEPKPSDAQVPGTLRSWTTTANGVKVGFIGIVEKEWIATVPSFPPTFVYRNMVQSALQLSRQLRDPNGEACELIVAITHSRLPNDIDFANQVGAVASPDADSHGIDLVLGGHDHIYYVGNGAASFEGQEFGRGEPGTEQDKAAMVVKSGTDFRDLSELKLQLSDVDPSRVRRRTIERLDVQRYRASPDDPTKPELEAMLDQLLSKVSQSTGQAVAHTVTPWDVRSEKVRTDESAIGDFIADVLMESYEEVLRERDNRGELADPRPAHLREVDCCIICGGSLRGDQVYGPGKIALSDVLEIMPFEDAVVCKELTGQDIWDALENGLSMYPKQEGRFPQVAGMRVKWDSRKPPGQRLISVELLERPLDSTSTTGAGGSSGGNVQDDGESTPDAAATRSGDGDGDGDGDGPASLPEGKARGYSLIAESDGNGYHVSIHRPALRVREALDLSKTYRVVTREYLAEGYDGFEALKRGREVIDHENGQLMSAIVRKFLLGASYIWRMKAVRQLPAGSATTGNDESHGAAQGPNGGDVAMPDASADGAGPLAGAGEKTLSKRTKEAILRARALGMLEAGGAGKQPGAAAPRATAAAPATPSKGKGAGAGAARWTMVVDQSPGMFRDALHVGGSEHHSAYDRVSQRFNLSTGTEAETRADKARGEPLPRSATGAHLPTSPIPSAKRPRLAQDDGAADADADAEAETDADGTLSDPSLAPTLLARIRTLCTLLEQTSTPTGQLTQRAPSTAEPNTTADAEAEPEPDAPASLLHSTIEDDLLHLPTLPHRPPSAQTHPTALSDTLVSHAREVHAVLARLRRAAQTLEGGDLTLGQQAETVDKLEAYVARQEAALRRVPPARPDENGSHGSGSGNGGTRRNGKAAEPHVVSETVHVNEEDVRYLREEGEDLAVVSPLCDGRLVDVARGEGRA